ncbi:putative 7-deoxyloganetic acid glucosyltransferase [Rosa chinensis]|uniref:Glycosyltransferase n=1 Tax=Rosa chinensis TaxID=74649 RepID=A0A2P6R9I3_ROSCH|nr:7-deoxyloganetic acid glucosyltransferase [Rosa chinensis]PRQ43071.1 putative 7-deoxyloganetic acid glucosyltransferase [Rosa chinensis]
MLVTSMEKSQSHVVIFPFPLQGHIKPLLCLAELLCHAGLHVTFVNTRHNHNRLANLRALSAHFPTLHFESILDGLPDDHPRTLGSELLIALKTSIKPHFKELLQSSLKANSVALPPPTCIITDGLVTFAFDVAEELGLPVLSYNVPYARYMWTCLCLPNLIEQGQLPFPGDDMNVEITGVPGMEGLLRRVDLPGFCRVKESSHPGLQFAIHEAQTQKRASALILDTIYELDASCLSHMANMFPKIYTLGPLHSLLHSQIGDVSRSLASHGGLWKGDPNCMTWLDSQPTKSVLYVSFGTLVTLTRTQIIEFWYGLVNSGHPFLWVVQSDITSGIGEDPIPMELEIGTKERGYIVNWVSQEEVLAHKSMGGFLTHSGWNSTLESIVAGIPMICWPNLGDHYIISRTVCEKWKIGLRLKENCDRKDIETMIRMLMEFKRGEIQSSMDSISKVARDSVTNGGSSNHNLQMLIQDIGNMHARPQ